MKVRIVAVGGVKGALGEVVAEYERRSAHYWKVETREVEAGAKGRNPSPERVRAAEGERILGALDEGMELWILTRDGKAMDSAGLAAALESVALRGGKGVTVVIGGAFGVDLSVLDRGARRISLSALTLPHEVARLLLMEQLYRAGTILRGEPYHKGPGRGTK